MDRSVGATGFPRIDTVATVVTVTVLVGIVLFLGVVLWPAYQRAHWEARVIQCGGNLRAVGQAMRAYANDYNGALPVAGGKGARWTGHLRDWSAPDRSQAFAPDSNGSNAGATVSSSLYLLVRYMQLDPKSFVCPVDRGTRFFRPERYGMGSRGLGDSWDFGPDPARHCSYAYQMVYSPYKVTLAAESAFAIAADRNPWIEGPAGVDRAGEFSSFVPDLPGFRGTGKQADLGNASAHQRVGQNVLFLDMHTAFEHRPYCGCQDDNIYTAWDGKDSVRGKLPKPGCQPADARDSLLVNDPPASHR